MYPMTNGSNHSAAGPSQPHAGSATPESSDAAAQGYYYTNVTHQPGGAPTLTHPYAAGAPSQDTTSPSFPGQPYYNYSAWRSGWPVGAYPYSGGGHTYQPGPGQHYPQSSYTQYQPQSISQNLTPPQQNSAVPISQEPKSPTPPTSDAYRHWDEMIKSFLTRIGLTQAFRGFESDLLVMNPDWERKVVPDALEALRRNLLLLDEYKGPEKENLEGRDEILLTPERPLEDRKLDYVHLSNGAQPRSQTSINKSISLFLAKNRARNDASNRAEFVRGKFSEESNGLSTCARTDAKSLDRDVQMKYDIAKNDDGPLRRTVKNSDKSPPAPTSELLGKKKTQNADQGPSAEIMGDERHLTSDRHPGLDQRLINIEKHLSVRYVPSPPRTLLDRLRFLEDHIIKLEKEYPPWAALHFNQPNRGWPPPPRSTPIIVPTHMRPATQDSQSPPGPDTLQATGAKHRNTASSLHRAVLERLEVQRAMSDLAGSNGDSQR